MIRRWIVKVLRWLLGYLDPSVPHPSDALTISARHTVEDLRNVAHTGSYKRVLAMKALMKKFPGRRRRDLALAIELAVQDLP
jgi:hypothetical protein